MFSTCGAEKMGCRSNSGGDISEVGCVVLVRVVLLGTDMVTWVSLCVALEGGTLVVVLGLEGGIVEDVG